MGRIKPTRDTIIGRVLETTKELKCGLISVAVGKEWKQEQLELEIVAVGPWVLDVNVGDHVIVSGHSGKWLDHGTWDKDDMGTTYRILREEDILLVLEQVFDVADPEKQPVAVGAD